MTLGRIRINNIKFGGRWQIGFHRLELTSDLLVEKETFPPLKFPSGVYGQICSLGPTALIFAGEEVPAVMVGAGEGSAFSVRSGRPPEMPSGRSLQKSLRIFAAVSCSPVAARPPRIIFSRYQAKTSLMSVPKTCLWTGGSGVSSGSHHHLPDGEALVPCTPRSDFFFSPPLSLNGVLICFH